MDSGSYAPLLETFVDRLHQREWLDIEYKAARKALPKDLWPTISSFANTLGGWIILGIADDGEVVGVRDPDELVKIFYDLCRNPTKISHAVCTAQDVAIETLGDASLVVIRVPAAARRDRPVYINANPYYGTFVRSATGDYRCTKQEVDRMMREAAEQSADSTILSGFGEDDIEADSLRAYRQRYRTHDPASPINGMDDAGFLEAVGALGRDRERGLQGLTVAGLLLLGKGTSIRQWRTRHLIDYRHEAPDTNERWVDRIAWDGNLLGAFEAIYPKLIAGHSVPFQLVNGVRVSDPPLHQAMREALVNLLVHADYAESGASLIERADLGNTFRNPGSSRVPEPDLYSHVRSDPRNPTLVRMFRLIGLADEAGTGIPTILQAWRTLDFQTPEFLSPSERYEFVLHLRHVHLISEDDRHWLDSLDQTLSEAEQIALLTAFHGGDLDNGILRRLTGMHGADVTKVLGGLAERRLLTRVGERRASKYELGPRAEVPVQGSLWSDDIGGSEATIGGSGSGIGGNGPSIGGNDPLDLLATLKRALPPRRRMSASYRDQVIRELCAQASLSVRDLCQVLDRSADTIRPVVVRLVATGILIPEFPDQPRHPRQRYRAPIN